MSQFTTTTSGLDNGVEALLTCAALEFVPDDQITFAWHDGTPLAGQRASRDLPSMQDALSRHSRTGSSSELMLGAACCCCTPACCCTAVAVVKATA